MDPAYFCALSALAGATIDGFTSDGFTSLGTSWLTQHAQVRAQRLAHEITRREELNSSDAQRNGCATTRAQTAVLEITDKEPMNSLREFSEACREELRRLGSVYR